MAKKKRYEDIIYEKLYGDIPDDQMGRVSFILGDRGKNEKFVDDIEKAARKIKRMKKIKFNFTMWKIVKPSARPRANTTTGYVRMYVPHAKENGNWFKDFAEESKLPYIDTPCILNMKVYEQTPKSFSIKNKVLAELGLIRPWKRTGDFDNYAKGIADAIQHGMLKDDCLVIESTQKLYYSIKPHAEIEIIYYEKFPKY